MIFHIVFQLLQHRSGTNECKHNFSAICGFRAWFESLHDLNQFLQIIVQSNISGIHNDELAIQTILLPERQNLLIIFIQRINLVLIDPVVDHDGFGNFLPFETFLHSFHQITADCNHKVAPLAAELVKPPHNVRNELALGIANGQHLLWIEVLNIINVLGVFHPFAPNAKQTAKNRRLRN